MNLRTWINAQLATLSAPSLNDRPTAENAAIVTELKHRTAAAGLYELSLSLPIQERKYCISVLAQLKRCLAALSIPVEDGALLGLNDAARILGYRAAGLRKIVKRGEIQFIQNGSGPIKFRREWLDEYIEGNARQEGSKRSPAQKRTTPASIRIEPQFGFDPALYSR